MRPLAAIACLALAACGGDRAPPDPGDDPPVLDIAGEGDSIGLSLDGAAALAVRYHDTRGPIASTSVSFELVAAASETTAGSTLSASAATTDEEGRAEVTVSAGGARANFRVRATAPGAAPVLFYVSVSDDGFTRLTLAPVHRGFRPDEALTAIELRLYPTAQLTCAGFDASAPAESVMPPRTLAGFGGVAEFPSLPAADPLTVAAWAVAAPEGLPLAIGCVELPASALPAGQAVTAELPVDDRPPALPAALTLTSRFDTAPVLAAIAPAADPWGALACPLGPAQLAIDCALDAAVADGALDCVATGSGALATAVAARRAPAIAGCRPATLAGGGDSVDRAVMDAIEAPWSGADLARLLAAQRAPLDEIAIGSTLTAGGGQVRHRLASATVSLGDDGHTVDLVASPRPIVEASVVATIATDGQLTLAPHAFTLDFRDLARAAFVALAPAELDADALGAALVESVADASGSGCAALSRLVCGEADLAPACLVATCPAAASALDDRLAAWSAALAADGLDFTLSTTAPVTDADLDLVIDGLGEDAGWSATLALDDGEVALSGDLAAAPGQNL